MVSPSSKRKKKLKKRRKNTNQRPWFATSLMLNSWPAMCLTSSRYCIWTLGNDCSAAKLLCEKVRRRPWMPANVVEMNSRIHNVVPFIVSVRRLEKCTMNWDYVWNENFHRKWLYTKTVKTSQSDNRHFHACYSVLVYANISIDIAVIIFIDSTVVFVCVHLIDIRGQRWIFFTLEKRTEIYCFGQLLITPRLTFLNQIKSNVANACQ